MSGVSALTSFCTTTSTALRVFSATVISALPPTPIRNTALYLFAEDSWKIKSNVTLNYGLRWELNTPYYDTGNRLQTFRPGEATTQYPCFLSAANAAALGLTPGDCGEDTTNGNNAVFPLGLVFPGDKGVPRGLTSTYYK